MAPAGISADDSNRFFFCKQGVGEPELIARDGWFLAVKEADGSPPSATKKINGNQAAKDSDENEVKFSMCNTIVFIYFLVKDGPYGVY